MTEKRTIPFWVQQFNIDESTWQTLCSQASRQGITPLDIALDTGLLNENKLLSLDRDQSKIISLKNIFFNGPAPVDLFKEFDFAMCRAQACIPIARWDGGIIFAKLTSLPTELETLYPNSIWVLAPWTGMKKWFEIWMENTQGGAKRKVVISKPNNNMGTLRPDALPLDKAVSKALKIEDTPLVEEAPMGLVDTQKLNVGSVDFSKILSPEKASDNPNEVTKDLSHPQGPSEPEAAVFTEVTKDISEFQEEPNLSHPPVPKVAPPKAPPKAPPPPPPVDDTDFSFITNTRPTPPAPPTAATAPAAPPPPKSPVSSQTANATPPSDIEAEWLKYFDQGMVIHADGQSLKAGKIFGSWPVLQNSLPTISADQPSIFKIVMATGQPYHGPASRGAGNELFFKTFLEGRYPDHVSLLPITVHGKISAMVLGCGKITQVSKVTLTQLQKLAHTLHESYSGQSQLKVS